MHRSNPLSLASGLLFLSALGLLWYVFHDFPVDSKFFLGIVYCALASLAGFWMWQHGQRLARIIEDIPTSRIASAPQGYVELLGQAKNPTSRRSGRSPSVSPMPATSSRREPVSASSRTIGPNG